MNPINYIKHASEIARNQTDKAGKDYYEGHLTSVASMGKTWQEQVLGCLHDVSEDTLMTEKEVMELLQKEEKLAGNEAIELYETLRLFNSNHFADRESYLKAVKENSLAKAVKINDLSNNMDLTRIANPSVKDIERVEKYKREIAWMISER